MKDFVWIRGVKGPSPQRWEYRREDMTSNWWKDLILFRKTLTIEEESLTLDELSLKYPLDLKSD